MRNIAVGGFAVLLVVSLAVPCTFAETTDKTPEPALPDGQARVVIPVEGMTCGGCCASVESAMKKLEGVVAAKADYREGWAKVTYVKDKVTVKQIVETINDNTSFKASMPKKTEKKTS